MGLNVNNHGYNPWNLHLAYSNPEGVEHHLFTNHHSTPSGLDQLFNLFPRFHLGLFTSNPFRVALPYFMVDNEMIHKS